MYLCSSGEAVSGVFISGEAVSGVFISGEAASCVFHYLVQAPANQHMFCFKNKHTYLSFFLHVKLERRVDSVTNLTRTPTLY